MATDNPWNTLEIVKLALQALTPIIVLLIGFQINQTLERTRAEQKKHQEEQEKVQARQDAVRELARYIYERRARAELLASSLKRGAEIEEIKERKRLYDESYFHWNANLQSMLFLVRKIIRHQQYEEFQNLIETRLVLKAFQPLDSCITRAYDAKIAGNDPVPILDKCNVSRHLKAALDCGYVITDTLYKVADPSYQEKENREQLVDYVNQRCP